jgi:hypothetical protein
MNIESFEYYYLYSISSSSNISDDFVIKFNLNFHRIYPWLLFPCGFIGSLLTILIFTRKTFQKFGCSILFVAESFMVNRIIFVFKHTKINLIIIRI